MSDDRTRELDDLLAELREGAITPDRFESLQALLRTDAAARQRYLESAMIWTLLMDAGQAPAASPIPTLSPAEPDPGGDTDVEASTAADTPVRGPLARLMPIGVALAALLAVALTVWVVVDHNRAGSERVVRKPAEVQPGPLATITEMNAARWSTTDHELHPQIGMQLAHRTVSLESGTTQLMFNGGAVVDLIGPASFELRSDREGVLHSGRLMVWVPAGVDGFTVSAKGMRVVDLGTRFGMSVSATHSEVFVEEGAVRVEADRTKPVTLKEGEAVRVGAGGAMQRLAAGEVRFNRRPVTAPPDRVVDLVDVLAGGDGTGVSHGAGVMPTTGRVAGAWSQPDLPDREVGQPGYRVADWHPLIDGVFIPDGGSGPVVLDSAGHTFDGFPDTDLVYGTPIWAHRAAPRDVGAGDRLRANENWIRVAGSMPRYYPEGRGLIALHANAAITFDLDAIRSRYSGRRLLRFHATTGNALDAGTEPEPRLGDVWVLVDGEVRFKRLRINLADGPFEVDVDLDDGERFLTLVATDAGNSHRGDQIVFGDPVIELTPLSR